MKKKKLLILAFALVLLVTTLSIGAFAANAPAGFEKFTSDSTYKPVDYSSHKSVSTVKLYGNVDYLCMKAYSETNKQETFVLELYSDSARTKEIDSLEMKFAKGTHYEDILVDLTGYKSGTYYATSYVIKKANTAMTKYEKDPDTVVNFKISVNRDGTSLSNMRSVLVGYENSAAGPVLAWYSVPGAKGYYIYRLEDGKYKKIATVEATDEDFGFYIDTGKMGKNGTAYYKIKAYNGSKTTAYSDTLKVYLLKTPTVKASLTSDGRIKVSWTKVSSSCDYAIYRRTATGDWNIIGASTNGNLYFYDKNVANNTVYYYTVLAATDNTVSGYDPVGASVRFIAAPELKSVTDDGDALTVSWKALNYAHSYIVYRKEAGTGWKTMATLSDTVTSYTDTTAQENKVYTYTVRATIAGKKGAYSTAGIKGVNFSDIVLNEIEVVNEKSVKLTWNDIGDVSYKVYRKSDKDTSWKLLRTVKNAEFVDTEAQYFTVGSTYSYTVKPSLDKLDGAYVENSVSFVYLRGVKSLIAYGYENSIGLQWEKVVSADGYNIYRRADGEYEFLATTDKAEYIDTTAAGDIGYTYKVTYNIGGVEMTDYSAEINAKLLTDRSPLSTERYIKYNGSLIIYIDSSYGKAHYKVYKKVNGVWKDTDDGHMAPDGHLIVSQANFEEGAEYAVTAAYSDGSVTNISNGSFVADIISPAVLTGTANQSDYSISLSWNAVEGAEKYILYKWDKPVAVLEPTVTEYFFTNLKADDTHRYTLGTVKNGIEFMSRHYVGAIVKKENLESAELKKDCITLTWRDSDKTYFLYRKAEGESKWTKIHTASYSSSYNDKNVVDGTTYYYALRSEYHDVYSDYSEEPSKITFIKAPKITSFKLSGSAITVTWEKSEIADYYIVYRKETVKENGTSKTGSWKVVCTTTSGNKTSFKDTDVEGGNKYTYAVKAVKGSERSTYISKSLTFISAPVVVSAKAVTGGIKVTFKQTEGALKYYIYRKTAGGEWVKVGSAAKDATSYTDKTAEKGIKYTYTVRGVSGTTQSSNYSGKTCTRTK